MKIENLNINITDKQARNLFEKLKEYFEGYIKPISERPEDKDMGEGHTNLNIHNNH